MSKKFLQQLKLLYTSLSAFKEENLAKGFQTMYQIQPTKKINKGTDVFAFTNNPKPLPESFTFGGQTYNTDVFLEDTDTSGLLVIANDQITYENYFLGATDQTLLSSNSVCKSFVSALMGIAVSEGYIDSVEDSIAKYIPDFEGTELARISIKNCLQMSSGIAFDEDTDMSKLSISMLLGKPAMQSIAKMKLEQTPGDFRKYASINTEILGTIITNATGRSLGDYMEEKIWTRIGMENDAYWTLSNDTELAMGGLSVALRDYGRFGRLYLHQGNWNGEQIIPAQWIKDSVDTTAPQLCPGPNNKTFDQLGYGYQWWMPEGDEGEFMAIGIYSQWIYVNPAKQVIIVKTSACPEFMEKDHEFKTIALFRAIADSLS
ncbi:MAG: serine hydrolase domain-containing protein [Cellulosilyticaceae bacterium]